MYCYGNDLKANQSLAKFWIQTTTNRLMLRDMEQSQNAEKTLEHWSSFEGKIAKNDEGDF